MALRVAHVNLQAPIFVALRANFVDQLPDLVADKIVMPRLDAS
ncbi:MULTISPECIES: hypothetical protein [Bradyrhizobium]|nr:hypothetical protein [Bradyrhizobium elkanii]